MRTQRSPRLSLQLVRLPLLPPLLLLLLVRLACLLNSSHVQQTASMHGTPRCCFTWRYCSPQLQSVNSLVLDVWSSVVQLLSSLCCSAKYS